MLIEDTRQLEEFRNRHRGVLQIGFDTEFVRERTYYPRLEIFQIIAEGEIAVIDCQVVENLAPLWEFLADPAAEKIVHSGSQDMELILQESGCLPKPIFDTQIAASLLGFGSQCGYGRLVYELLGKKVPKGETFSDWSRRPLHADQVRYAHADVEHLPELRKALGKKLSGAGREHWVHEECSHLSEPETFHRHPPELCYLKIKGRSGLDPESLSVLRSLAEWREREAQSRNQPPGRVVGDHVLLSIAKSAPRSMDELRRQRGLHANEISRCGTEILRAAREGLGRAKSDPVERSSSSKPRSEEEDDGLFRLLGAVLQIQAEEARVAPAMIATSQELRDLVIGFRTGNLNGLPLLAGWRGELAGFKLLAVLEGKLSLRVDPRKGTLLLEDVHE